MRPLIRAALGDFGIRDSSGDVVAQSQDFHDDDINSTITLTLLRFADYSGDGENITPAFANDNDQGAVTYYVALILVLPAGTFSLDTPNMKYWVQANLELISHMIGQIGYFLNEGDLRPSINGALDQLYNEGVLITNRVSEAVGLT